MQIDCIVVGQGLAGTLLSHALGEAGMTYVVIDAFHEQSASRISTGVINPVTGQRLIRSWMIDTLLPVAVDHYRRLETLLGGRFMEEYTILRFPSSAEQQTNFLEKAQDDDRYLEEVVNENPWQSYFKFHHGIGAIRPGYQVAVPALLMAWRKYLDERQRLLPEQFDWSVLSLKENSVSYRNLEARYLLLCQGAAGYEDPFFQRLPYSANKGEAIIASIPGLPATHIYKQDLTIAPWTDGQFWIGSTYEWHPTDTLPTMAFRQKVKESLERWLRLPYEILEHKAAIRPSAVGHRPFVGLHPLHRQVGILNGLGTKAVSVGPFAAQQLAQHLSSGAQLQPELDIARYQKILSRP